MVSAGQLIWVSFRPLLRLVLSVLGGFVITKVDIFPAVAARGAGQVALNITMPCLMFSKMVPAFSSSNISVLGPLFAIGAIYQFMGIGLSWLIKQFFWVPHRFRYGMLAAGGWGNYGDIPTAVIMSITGAAPFNGEADQDLAVAYISALILYYMFTFFPLGGNRLIALDFKGPEVEPEEVQESIRTRRKFLLCGWPKALKQKMLYRLADPENTDCENQFKDSEMTRNEKALADEPVDLQPCPGLHVPYHEDATIVAPSEAAQPICRTEPESTVTTHGEHKDGSTSYTPAPFNPSRHPILRRWKTISPSLRTAVESICMPASLAIIVSLVIALITPVKALFVQVDGYYMPSAPDGDPPLAFIIDFAGFMGAASVPLGLICLGSALARLKVPHWSSMPLGAILSLAVGRMVAMPVLGVLICKGLIHVNFISKEDKVLQFVCIFFSRLPTATTQVFVTQVYSGTGSADHLPAFLIPQYFLMFLSMTALSAFTLQLLF
ncbi:auxin efflux carrier [Guyanagaster necrorhizus]|uniref:Auxin efflux carrier n=1 Tax=Guyanagaster necrorhizus TaxID=856835 RepID=A0A9P7VHE8_9AGAR|nr:auxin efflux carrier [Guyanagaster necrorhizus MCA 3950]KAG7441091.1 auxin efflux carrier [Guyanagaster necrorhizus MCA 3950]